MCSFRHCYIHTIYGIVFGFVGAAYRMGTSYKYYTHTLRVALVWFDCDCIYTHSYGQNTAIDLIFYLRCTMHIPLWLSLSLCSTLSYYWISVIAIFHCAFAVLYILYAHSFYFSVRVSFSLFRIHILSPVLSFIAEFCFFPLSIVFFYPLRCCCFFFHSVLCSINSTLF